MLSELFIVGVLNQLAVNSTHTYRSKLRYTVYTALWSRLEQRSLSCWEQSATSSVYRMLFARLSTYKRSHRPM